jgi:hypothetical protein
MKFVIGLDQVYFFILSHLHIEMLKVEICGKGIVTVHFDLAGLKTPSGACVPRQNFYSSDEFCIPNCCKLQRNS